MRSEEDVPGSSPGAGASSLSAITPAKVALAKQPHRRGEISKPSIRWQRVVDGKRLRVMAYDEPTTPARDAMRLQRNFVTFYSPGTFVAETDEHPVDTWDTDKAMEIARTIKQRHGARPYGFRFTTRSRGDVELDSKVTATSNFYYLGGRVETLAEVEARADPKEHILRANMRVNGYDRVIVNDNSYRWTQPMEDDDVILDFAFDPAEPT